MAARRAGSTPAPSSRLASDIRLDLFQHLSGQPMRFFADQLAGSLGSRITAAASGVAGLIRALAWSIRRLASTSCGCSFRTRRLADGLALLLFVAALVLRARALSACAAGRCTKPTRRRTVGPAASWSTPSPTCGRSRPFRPAVASGERLARSWPRMRTRTSEAGFISRRPGSSTIWAVVDRRLDAGLVHPSVDDRQASRPGEVVMVSALTFRILHGSRELGAGADRHASSSSP